MHYLTRGAPGWRSAWSRARSAHPDRCAALPAPYLPNVNWTPLFVAFVLFIFMTTSYRLNIGSAVMAIGVFGVCLQRDSIRFPLPLLLFGAFILWSYFSFSHWVFREVTFEHLIDLDKVWLIGLVAANALRTRGELRVFTLVFLVSFALFPVRGAMVNSFVYHYARTFWAGVFGNPNDLAAMVLLQVSMLLGLLATERSRWVRAMAALGVVVFPVVILLTQSRGALLATGVFVLFLFVKTKRRGRLLLKLAVVAALIVPLAPKSTWDRLGGLGKMTSSETFEDVDPEGSARNRYNIWRVASLIIHDHPVTGVGSGAYPFAHEVYSVQNNFDRRDQGRRDTHSTYLNILAENGAPGFVLFLAMLASALWDAERVRRRCRHALPREAEQLALLQCGVLSFLFAGLFGSFGYISFLYIQLMLVWSTARACERDLDALPPLSDAPNQPRRATRASMMLALPVNARPQVSH